MLIAIIGLIINIISTIIIMSDKSYKIDINIRSAFLHLIGDTGASFAVIIGMIFIIYTGIRIIDPIVAILISLLILFSTIRVLLKSTGILLQKSPVNVEKIIEEIKEIVHVNGVEDVHFWQVCSYFIVGTANVITDLEKIEDTENIRREIAEILKVKYNVQHITLQFETPEMSKLHKHQSDHKH
jgi:cobalt-zinc-cadmium efflux system protein